MSCGPASTGSATSLLTPRWPWQFLSGLLAIRLLSNPAPTGLSSLFSSKALISYSLIKRLARALCTPNTQILGQIRTLELRNPPASSCLLKHTLFSQAVKAVQSYRNKPSPLSLFTHTFLSSSQTLQTCVQVQVSWLLGLCSCGTLGLEHPFCQNSAQASQTPARRIPQQLVYTGLARKTWLNFWLCHKNNAGHVTISEP